MGADQCLYSPIAAQGLACMLNGRDQPRLIVQRALDVAGDKLQALAAQRRIALRPSPRRLTIGCFRLDTASATPIDPKATVALQPSAARAAFILRGGRSSWAPDPSRG